MLFYSSEITQYLRFYPSTDFHSSHFCAILCTNIYTDKINSIYHAQETPNHTISMVDNYERI